MLLEYRDYQKAAINRAVTQIKYRDMPGIVVLPTGSGKTIVIKGIVDAFPQSRILVIAHRKELLEQTADKLDDDFGFFSASIGQKDLSQRITIAGIQSIHRQPPADIDIIIIDECHLLPPRDAGGMYWKVIEANATAKLIGLTATPFRLKSGTLPWGEEVYSIDYHTLIERGYLAPIRSKLLHQPDLSGVPIKSTGDYQDDALEKLMSDPALVDEAVRRIIAYSPNRKSVLIFCVSVGHCEIMQKALLANGIMAEIITGATPKADRELILGGFKAGRIKYLINCEVLTTGFDAPNIDTIFCLRPTESKSLFEQIVGRGVRPHPAKDFCLLIDMGGNLSRHGPLGTPYMQKPKGESRSAPGKICPSCEEFVAPHHKQCTDCGYEWPEVVKQVSHEYEEDTDTPAVQQSLRWYDVAEIHSVKSTTKKGEPCIITSFKTSEYRYFGSVRVWSMPHHESAFARNKALQFFKQMGDDIYTGGDSSGLLKYSMDDLLWRAQNKFKKPKKILVDDSKQFPEIKQMDFGITTEELLDDSCPF